jgi:hypothetical protein
LPADWRFPDGSSRLMASLRGAERRSNPELRRRSGLLRFARNDAGIAAEQDE